MAIHFCQGMETMRTMTAKAMKPRIWLARSCAFDMVSPPGRGQPRWQMAIKNGNKKKRSFCCHRERATTALLQRNKSSAHEGAAFVERYNRINVVGFSLCRSTNIVNQDVCSPPARHVPLKGREKPFLKP